MIAPLRPESMRDAKGRPVTTRLLVTAHVAIIIAQLTFGGGAVVGKFGLKQGIKPIIFALVREGIAGPLLCLAAVSAPNPTAVARPTFMCMFRRQYAVDRALPARRDFWRFAVTGTCLYANQLLYIVGLSISNATFAAIWQVLGRRARSGLCRPSSTTC